MDRIELEKLTKEELINLVLEQSQQLKTIKQIKIKHLFIHPTNVMVVIATIVVLSISIGGFYSNSDWRLAWFSNLRPHFAMISALAVIWFLWRRNKVMSGVTLASLLINCIVLFPFFIQPSVAIAADNALDIVHLNINRGRADMSSLDAMAADVVFLQEVRPEVVDRLPGLFPSYTVVRSHPIRGSEGSAVLLHKESPLEIIGSDIINLPDYSTRPLIVTEAQFKGRSIKLLSLHLSRPDNEQNDAFQKTELDAAAVWSREMQQQGYDVIIVGDFNVTPWSNRFTKLLADGQLNDSLRGYGLQNTWPSTIPSFLRLPIDHALYSDGWATVARSTTAVSGSDHMVLRVSLASSDLTP